MTETAPCLSSWGSWSRGLGGGNPEELPNLALGSGRASCRKGTSELRPKEEFAVGRGERAFQACARNSVYKGLEVYETMLPFVEVHGTWVQKTSTNC